ncbi:MAG TPA: ectonucleotide pyrophosphatase/phosphodiesterase [Myxococcota bacterium]
MRPTVVARVGVRVLALLALLALACGGAGAAPAAREAPPTVILISLDGTRPEDVAELPLFRSLARRGAVAEGLVPVFPSNTFPNHVTFVTGVEPDRHGIVSNVFRDPKRGLFRYENDPTWLEAEPLWSLLARAGIPSASFHWVGSQGAWRDGLGPRHWEPFDAGVPADRKIAQLLAWLDGDDPPRFLTCWLNGVDGIGHRRGPGTAQAARALRAQERALAALVQGLEERGRLASTTLLLVSDHGMARVERHVDLEGALEEAGLRADVIGGGGFATVQLATKGGVRARQAALRRALEVAHKLGLDAWATGDERAEWPTTNPRFGAFVAVAPVGTAIVDGGRALAAPAAAVGLGLRGAHGHRPDAPEMAGLFYALGRGVEAGTRLGRVHALDVAPTVLHLLGQPQPATMPGRPVALGRLPLPVTPATGSETTTR